MCAFSGNIDIHLTGACHKFVSACGNHTIVQHRPYMKTENPFDMILFKDTAFAHRLRSARCFLSRLKNQYHVVRKLFIIRRQLVCELQQHCHVTVMSAGVHAACMSGCERSSGSFCYRQCIHITAKGDAFLSSCVKKSHNTAGNR